MRDAAGGDREQRAPEAPRPPSRGGPGLLASPRRGRPTRPGAARAARGARPARRRRRGPGAGRCGARRAARARRAAGPRGSTGASCRGRTTRCRPRARGSRAAGRGRGPRRRRSSPRASAAGRRPRRPRALPQLEAAVDVLRAARASAARVSAMKGQPTSRRLKGCVAVDLRAGRDARADDDVRPRGRPRPSRPARRGWARSRRRTAGAARRGPRASRAGRSSPCRGWRRSSRSRTRVPSRNGSTARGRPVLAGVVDDEDLVRARPAASSHSRSAASVTPIAASSLYAGTTTDIHGCCMRRDLTDAAARLRCIIPALMATIQNVVILCGGRGTRLQEHTQSIPKPLVEIGGRADPLARHPASTPPRG